MNTDAIPIPIRIRTSPCNDPDHTSGEFAVHIFKQEAYDKGLPLFDALPVSFSRKAVKTGEAIDPSIVLSLSDAQRLFDDLWNSGLRPSARIPIPSPTPPAPATPQESPAHAGVIEAKNAHIADLRDLLRLCLQSRSSN